MFSTRSTKQLPSLSRLTSRITYSRFAQLQTKVWVVKKNGHGSSRRTSTSKTSISKMPASSTIESSSLPEVDQETSWNNVALSFWALSSRLKVDLLPASRPHIITWNLIQSCMLSSCLAHRFQGTEIILCTEWSKKTITPTPSPDKSWRSPSPTATYHRIETSSTRK